MSPRGRTLDSPPVVVQNWAVLRPRCSTISTLNYCHRALTSVQTYSVLCGVQIRIVEPHPTDIKLFPRPGTQLLATSQTFDPVHVISGMSYDHVAQLLATPNVNGTLFEEGVDFQAFDLEDSVFSMEDGIMVNSTWLSEFDNKVTLIKFLQVSFVIMVPCPPFKRLRLLPSTPMHMSERLCVCGFG